MAGSGDAKTSNVRLGRLAAERGEQGPKTARIDLGAFEAWRTGVPRALRISREGQEDVVVPLHSERTYTLGRGADCTIVLPADVVSRVHGMLSLKREQDWVFRDLGSVNGTFVLSGGHSRALRADEVRLGVGDVVAFAKPDGPNRIELLAHEAPASRPGSGRRSKASLELERFIDRSARHDLALVLLGGSGTGKTWLARAIHERSARAGNFAAINCAGLSRDANELHSELLGHVKGAYTGAVGERLGKVFYAANGTLFLDEVESMPREAQEFLLDVLDRRSEVTPLGASPEARRPVPPFRLISATKLPLAETQLRPDLVQRLAVGDAFALPTLEDRAEDIPELVEGFLAELAANAGLKGELAPEAIEFLQQQSWPGQLRELRSTVISAVQLASAEAGSFGNPGRVVRISVAQVREYLSRRGHVVGTGGPRRTTLPETPAAAARKRPGDHGPDELKAALERNGGNKARTARELGMALNTLKALLRRHGI